MNSALNTSTSMGTFILTYMYKSRRRKEREEREKKNACMICLYECLHPTN